MLLLLLLVVLHPLGEGLLSRESIRVFATILGVLTGLYLILFLFLLHLPVALEHALIRLPDGNHLELRGVLDRDDHILEHDIDGEDMHVQNLRNSRPIPPLSRRVDRERGLAVGAGKLARDKRVLLALLWGAAAQHLERWGFSHVPKLAEYVHLVDEGLDGATIAELQSDGQRGPTEALGLVHLAALGKAANVVMPSSNVLLLFISKVVSLRTLVLKAPIR